MSNPKLDAVKQEIGELVESLKSERDELKVQLHLAQADARDEWEQLEGKWQQFHEKAHVVGEAAGDASQDIGAAVRLLGDELASGYRRIRDTIVKQSKS